MTTVFRLSYDRAVKRGTENDVNPEILPAKHGHFSTPFFNKVRYSLEIAPALAAHIVNGKLLNGGTEGDRVQTTKEPPIPLSATAWDDSDEIYALLVYWCQAFAHELNIQAPGPAKRARMNERNRVTGLPANISSADARYVTGIMSRWLRTQLEPIMNLDPADVTEFANNMATVVTMSFRWPEYDRDSWSALPCPKCKGRVAIYVPTDPWFDGTRDERGRLVPRGGEKRFVCDVCQTALTDEEFHAEVDREAVSTKLRQQLTLRYGRNIPGEWRL